MMLFLVIYLSIFGVVVAIVVIVVVVVVVVVAAFPLFGASKDLIRDSQSR